MNTRLVAWSLLGTFVALGAQPARATVVGPLAPPVIDINGTALDLNALNCVTRNNLVTCGGANLQGNGYELTSWSLTLNPDPVITSSFTLTNISAVTQTFVMTVTLSAVTSAPAIAISGYVGPGTLIDADGGGATLTDAATSIYTAAIDGVAVHTLLDPPQFYSVIANPFGGPGDPVTIPMESFGPDVLAQSVTSFIQIRYKFSITARDQLQSMSQFTVTEVPIPGALPLLGAGLGLLMAFRRRRA